MAVLSVVQVTLVDDEAEKTFLDLFTKGAAQIDKMEGLISLSAWKQLGAERTYMAFSQWENEDAIDKHKLGEMEQKNIAMGKNQLLSAFKVQRFQTVGEERTWLKKA